MTNIYPSYGGDPRISFAPRDRFPYINYRWDFMVFRADLGDCGSGRSVLRNSILRINEDLRILCDILNLILQEEFDQADIYCIPSNPSEAVMLMPFMEKRFEEGSVYLGRFEVTSEYHMDRDGRHHKFWVPDSSYTTHFSNEILCYLNMISE